MKVLLVGINNRIFLRELQQHLNDSGIQADRFDLGEGIFEDYEGRKTIIGKNIQKKNFFRKNLVLWHNFIRFRLLFREMRAVYDVCNIHFMDVRYFFFRRFFNNVALKLVISIYGSDFYKYRKYSFLQKSFYKLASGITFANEDTLTSFNDYYNGSYKSKLNICKFGLSRLLQLQQICQEPDIRQKARARFGFPSDMVIITVGYHSNPITRQLDSIFQIMRLDAGIKNSLFFVFPMAYGGSESNRKAVETLAGTAGFQYAVIDNFLSDVDVALLRKASDIMIHLPVSDQLSATMCEYLYAGNYVITGKWLPYRSIDETGVYYSRIEGFDELSGLVKWAVQNRDDCEQRTAGNPEKIWNFSSWENNIIRWQEVYYNL